MFVYWGNQERTKFLGYTAHFCQVCNDITVMKVSERQEGFQLYLIPLGKYKFIHSELLCSVCNKMLVTKTSPDEFNYQKSQDLNTLKNLLSDDQTAEWDAQKEKKKELEINSASLSREERFDIIYRAFKSYENQVRLKFGHTGDMKIDKRYTPGCLSIVLIIFFTIFLGESYQDSSLGKFIKDETGLDGFAIVFLSIITIGLGQLLWCALTYKSYYFKTEVYPNLASSIAYLKPTLQELIQVQEKLKQEKLLMRKFSIPNFQYSLNEAALNRNSFRR